MWNIDDIENVRVSLTFHSSKEKKYAHKSSIISLDLCETKNLLVSCGNDKNIAVWNLLTGKEIIRFK